LPLAAHLRQLELHAQLRSVPPAKLRVSLLGGVVFPIVSFSKPLRPAPTLIKYNILYIGYKVISQMQSVSGGQPHSEGDIGDRTGLAGQLIRITTPSLEVPGFTGTLAGYSFVPFRVVGWVLELGYFLRWLFGE
jgi:xanthosine utilization system XapX-like protein